MAAATVNGGWKLVSRAGLFAGKPAPTAASINPRCVSTPIRCRSGFTREYGSGGNGERRVEIGQQGRPLRG
ncbi:diguanylate phosphodiesterase [Pseudomonas sp. FW305-E2]|nr:diguanylate phosphodiesterase [Pseudomonas sp. FW305-E2]PTV56558.1 diguanylate phosphodiesterase [Pseudomonas putida]